MIGPERKDVNLVPYCCFWDDWTCRVPILVVRLLVDHSNQEETVLEGEKDAGDQVEGADDQGAGLQGDTAQEAWKRHLLWSGREVQLTFLPGSAQQKSATGTDGQAHNFLLTPKKCPVFVNPQFARKYCEYNLIIPITTFLKKKGLALLSKNQCLQPTFLSILFLEGSLH